MPLIDDRFANVISVEVTESAANTETFQTIETGVSLGQQLGLVIDAIEYTMDSNQLALLAATGDWVNMAITTSDLVTDLDDPTDRRILDYLVIGTTLNTNGMVVHGPFPIKHEFSPPLIIASPRIYLGCDSASVATALVARARIFFRYVKLTPQEYLEVAETFLITS